MIAEIKTNSDGSVEADMHFLAKDELYQVEKPYSLRFPPDGDLAQTNIRREKHKLYIHDMRRVGDFTLKKNGFQVMPMASKMTYADFDDEERIKSIYLSEVKDTLMRTLGAKNVHVMDFVVRRRHASFPISTGEEFGAEQPAALAHVDFTVREGERLLNVVYGDRALDIVKAHWQIINVWVPLRGPLNDWPLALCDAQSVDFRNDVMAGDVVYEHFATENLQVLYNPNHKWFYLPGQTTSEALIFKSADSEHCTAPASPHASFYNSKVSPNELPRESIDCRAFVLYADLEEYPPVVENLFQRHG